MTVTTASFRQRFQEFDDPDIFRNIDIDFYIKLAAGDPPNNQIAILNVTRFRSNMDWAVMLFVAHNLVLDERNKLEARVGGVPGTVKGPVSSSAVDRVMRSYDIASITRENEGEWGLTIYGKRLYRMILMAGAGPIQL